MAVVPLSQSRLIPFPSCPQECREDTEICVVNVVGLAAALMVPWPGDCNCAGSANDLACQCAVMVLNSYLLHGQTIRRSRAVASDASATRMEADRQPEKPWLKIAREPPRRDQKNKSSREAV